VVVQADPQRQLGRLAGHRLGKPDDRAAGRGGGSEQPADRCPLGRVDDRHQVRPDAARLRTRRGADRPRARVVGKPLHPLPGRVGGGGTGGQEPEVVGSVEGGELADDGAGQGPGPVGRAGEGDDAEPAERDRHRGVGEAGRTADELLRRPQKLRVVLHEGVGGAVEPDRGGQLDRAAADAGREEVGVGRAALPEPVGPLDRRPEQGQVGMDVLGRGELGRGQVVGPARGLVEVAQVAGPLPSPRPVGRPPFDQPEGEAGQHRGDGRADHQGDQPDRARAREREQERDRPSAAGQRHQVLEPAGKAGGAPADRRRGRDRQLAGGRGPRMGPHRPVHHDAGWSGVGSQVHGRTLRPRRRPWAATATSVDNPLDRPLRAA
jgi:hypothetical protein